MVLSPIHTVHKTLSRVSDALSIGLGHFRRSGLLPWRQWLVLFAMGVVVIGIEVRNHTTMWRDHQSGQNFWTDRELVGETIIFGLIIPILGGIIIGYLQRATVDRDKAVRELELHHALVRKMHEAQNWLELVELIVTTPGTVASAYRAWLLAQRSEEEDFAQIAHWEDPKTELLPSSLPIYPPACEQCQQHMTSNGTRIVNCHHMNPESGELPFTRYCLRLSSDGMERSALLFDIPSEQLLDPAHLKMLDKLGDEMSLVIDNQNLQFRQQQQEELVNKERLKIARDLHDTLGQNISYLRLKLEQLSINRQTSSNSASEDELTKMLEVADVAYEQMRDTLDELRKLEQRDLQESVRLYALQAAERAGFSVNVRSSGQVGTISSRKSRQIIFIVREALNNIEKHADARNVDILLQWGEKEFSLTLRDDGQGFQANDLNKIGHYGLAIIEERSEAINGTVSIKSTLGEGSELTLRLPLVSGTIVNSYSQ